MLSTLLVLVLSAVQRLAAPAPPAPQTVLGPVVAGSAGAAGTAGAAVSALRADLERLVGSAHWRGDRWSVMVVSLDRGDTLFAHDADVALAPASNMKLFTSAAALYYLGPSFRYSTFLMSSGPIEGGTLRGDLVLYGTGDPTLSDRFYDTKLTVLEEFADSLAALGVTAVAGDVVGDASYFWGGPPTGLGWDESYMNTWYAAPASALAFNENIVTLYIRPAERPGWRPEVRLIPGGEGIALVNQATTVAGGRTRIYADRAAYDGPIVLRGQINVGSSGAWRPVPVMDPARFAAAVLREVLESRGIRVLGGFRSVHRPEDSLVSGRSSFAPAFDDRTRVRVLAVHRSPSLVRILEVVNKKSHNLFAEQVLRTVGRVALGEGSVQGGFRAVRYMLECETGLDSVALRMVDGSGLSRLNHVTARTVVELLSFMAASPVWASYWQTLPEAGNAHGLRRMYRTAAAGNLRAKTGTIDHVSALSGYVRARNGERLAFSIISNRVPSTPRAKRIEDAIGARLAAFDRPAVRVAGGGVPTAPVEPVVATTPAPPAAPDVYIIRRGDTLEEIARRHGTTVAALEAANPGIEPRRLIPGREILLP
ncbi:MAG TPA: D-alanyl-D-alanine carboxypeptidase/D-alanyl-D-alanine-endopeptidase [Longimicrobiales bacterium]